MKTIKPTWRTTRSPILSLTHMVRRSASTQLSLYLIAVATVWTANSLSADEVAIVPIVKDVIVDTGRHQAGLGDTIEVTVQHLLAWETAGPEGSEAGKKKHDRSSLIAFINGIGLNGVTGTTVIDKKAEWLKLNTQLKAATKDADEQSKKIAELMKQKDKGTDEEKKKLQSEIGELEKAVVESKGRTRELEQKQA